MKPTIFPFLSASQMLRCGVAFGILLQLGGSACADDWTTYQHDSAHTGRSSDTFNPLLLKNTWGKTFSLTRPYPPTPVIAGDSLYNIVGASGTTITSYNVLNGATRWNASYADLNGIRSPLSFAEGLLVFLANGQSFFGTRLFVVDAATGMQKYSVALPGLAAYTQPTIARNANNQLVAYARWGDQISAINLGTNSGSVMWTNSGNNMGTDSIPTIVGGSVVIAGPNQYYAFDQLTGAANHFLTSGTSGGGGCPVAFDSARMQFYVRDDYTGFLTAYKYTSNNDIQQVWRDSNSYQGVFGSVSIGADGRIYSARPNSVFELDPVDGHVLRSINGLPLASQISTTALNATSLFVDVPASQFSNNGSTNIYDLNTFSLVASVPRHQASRTFGGLTPVAISGFGYVIPYATDTTRMGFDVYLAIPEPSTLILALGIFGPLAARRRRRV
jgi:hypothetical protein